MEGLHTAFACVFFAIAHVFGKSAFSRFEHLIFQNFAICAVAKPSLLRKASCGEEEEEGGKEEDLQTHLSS